MYKYELSFAKYRLWVGVKIKLELRCQWRNLFIMPKPDDPKRMTREERLAEQLRANLRRRKAATKRLKANLNSSQKNTPSSP